MQRLLDAEAVAEAKVKEIEVAVKRIRDELADLGEKERAASGLKVTHTGEAQARSVKGRRSSPFSLHSVRCFVGVGCGET